MKFHIGVFFRGFLMVLVAVLPLVSIAFLLSLVKLRLAPQDFSFNLISPLILFVLPVIYIIGRVSTWINNHFMFWSE